MPKKKSLADELADLFNPAPTKEFDPEADVFGAGPALVESDEEGLGADLPRRGKEAGRMRGDIVMEGREYAGRRSSRAALFEEGGGGSEGEEEEGEEGQDQSSSEAEGMKEKDGEEGTASEGSHDGDSGSEGEGQEEGEQHGWLNGDTAAGSGSSSGKGEDEDGEEGPEVAAAGSGRAQRMPRGGAIDGSDGGSEGEGEGEGDEGEEEEGRRRGRSGVAASAAAAAEDAMAALEREYEQMQQDEQSALEGLKERANRERKKALAVKAQKAAWHKGLEARILLQRALAGANRLPQGRMQAAAVAIDSELAGAFEGLAADASALLGELLTLLRELAAQNPAIAAAASAAAPNAAAGTKRARQDEDATAEADDGEHQPSSVQLWRQLDEAYGGFAPFRDAAIDRWHRKTMLTTGGATLRGGQLRALNQSVSTQVALLMQDPGKVLQRARLLRSAQQGPQQRVLCPDPDGPSAKRQRLAAEGEQEQDGEANGVQDADAGDERDLETFDDTEFYQTLLREFLEGSSNVGSGANWHTGPKQRKAVDRRASKGRKLRYHVHDKLVNFMVPVELDAPQYTAQLFSNLFGGGSGGGGGGRK